MGRDFSFKILNKDQTNTIDDFTLISKRNTVLSHMDNNIYSYNEIKENIKKLLDDDNDYAKETLYVLVSILRCMGKEDSVKILYS